MKSKLLKVTAAFVGTCLLATTAFATTGTVTTNNLRIRQDPVIGDNVIEIAGKGDNIEVKSEEGDWYEVVYNGKSGYASKQYVSVSGEIVSSEDEEEDSSQSNVEEQNNEPVQEQPEETPVEETKPEEKKPETVAKPTVAKIDLKGKALDVKIATSMYLLPTFTSRVNQDLAEGSNVIVLYDMQKWLKVEFAGNVGWISSAYLDINSVQETTQEPEEQPEEQPEENTEEDATPSSDYEEKQGYINTTIVNIRAEASTDSDVVGGLEEFTNVTIIGEEDDFYQIRIGNITGYVAKRLITIGDSGSRSLNSRGSVSQEVEVESVSATPTNNASYNASLGEQIVEEAKQYLGYDYVYAGKSPETGFDCSGFTRYVYGQFGIGLGGSSGSQANVGTEVDEDDMQPGDLLIYLGSDNSGVGHVGIYEGEGMFIHAANPTRGVVEDSINNSYYAPRLVSVRRLAD